MDDVMTDTRKAQGGASSPHDGDPTCLGEDWIRKTTESTPVLISMADEDKRWNFFSRGWLKFTGRPMEEEIGEGWFECVHPEETEEVRKCLDEAFDSHQNFEIQFRLRRADGDYKKLSAYGRPRRLKGGRFGGYICLCVNASPADDSRAANRAR